eukprot:Skav206320  [mRNA]  locus=scaffold1420:57563:57973:+ [translate_table: standard]
MRCEGQKFTRRVCQTQFGQDGPAPVKDKKKKKKKNQRARTATLRFKASFFEGLQEAGETAKAATKKAFSRRAFARLCAELRPPKLTRLLKGENVWLKKGDLRRRRSFETLPLPGKSLGYSSMASGSMVAVGCDMSC